MAAYADGRPATGRAAVAGHSGCNAVAVAGRWQRGGGGRGQAGTREHLAVRANVQEVLGQKQCVRPRPPRNSDGSAQTGAVAPWSVAAGALAGTASPLTVARIR